MPKKETYYTEIDGKPYARVPYLDTTSGKWKTKTRRVATKSEARAVAQKLKAEIASQQKRTTLQAPDTFEELLERYPRPLPKFYADLFRENFGPRPLDQITYDQLDNFRLRRLAVKHRYTGEPRQVSATNRGIQALQRVLNYAVKRGWLARSPFHDGETLVDESGESARDRIATREEIQKLLAACDCPEREHLKILILIERDTGLRKGKLLSLRLPQIDLKRGLIDLGKPKSGNKLHPRYAGITDETCTALRSYLSNWGDRPIDGLIFEVKDFKRSWRTACRLAGIKDLHFHDLRHTYATEAILSGLPKDLVMKLTGHTQDKTFARYLNVDQDIARLAAEALTEARKKRASE